MAFNARSLRDNSADPSLLFRKSKGKSKSESERGGITEVKRRSLRMPWFGSGRRTPFEADVSCESARGPLAPIHPSRRLYFHRRLPCCREYLQRRAGTTPSIATPNRRRRFDE